METPRSIKALQARKMVLETINGRLVLAPEQLPAGSQALPDTGELGTWLPAVPTEVGDKVVHQGYIERLGFHEFGYVPAASTDRAELGNNLLKSLTYCVVVLSTLPDREVDPVEFRILYSGPEGEKLATSMAVLAALKDAFLQRIQVRLHAEARQVVCQRGPGLQVCSDLYLALQAIECLRA